MDKSIETAVESLDSLTKAVNDAIPKAAAAASAQGVRAALRHDYSKEIGWQGKLWGNHRHLKDAAVAAARYRAHQKVYDRAASVYLAWEQELRALIPELERMASHSRAAGMATSDNVQRPLWPTPRRSAVGSGR